MYMPCKTIMNLQKQITTQYSKVMLKLIYVKFIENNIFRKIKGLRFRKFRFKRLGFPKPTGCWFLVCVYVKYEN